MRPIFMCGFVVMLAGAALPPPAFAEGAKRAASAAKGAAPKKATKKPAPAKKAGSKGAATAGGDPTDPKNLARARYDKARAAEQAGELQTAYEEYRASFAFNADWKTELAWAHVALKLGKPREAAEMFRHVTASPEAAKALDPAASAELQKGLSDAKAKIGQLQIEAPAGAEVWVGGSQVGVAPLKEDTFVDPGEHDIGARRDGAVLAVVHVKVEAGTSAPVKLVEGAGLSAPSAAPSVTAAPSAVPSVTAAEAAPPPVASSAPAPVSPAPGPKWPAVIALGGAALAGAAVGAGLWITADGDLDEARSTLQSSGIKSHADCAKKAADCSKITELLGSHDTFQTGAVIAWGVGGAAAVGAVIVWAATRKSAPKVSFQVVPLLSPERAGLGVTGRF